MKPKSNIIIRWTGESGEYVEMGLDSFANTWPDLVEEYISFLRAIGFVIPQNVEVYAPEEEES